MTEFRPIPGFSDLGVSREGVIVRLTTSKTLKPATRKNGYLFITIRNGTKKTTLTIHRAVALAWVPNVNSERDTLVAHLDGSRTNNVAENLVWADYKTNAAHMKEHGTQVYGEDCHSAKLTAQQVVEIRSKYKRRVYGSTRLAREYGVSHPAILKIVKGVNWKTPDIRALSRSTKAE